MPLSRIKIWQPGDTLTAADLNAEFNNPLDNPMDLVNPLVLPSIGVPTTAGQVARNGAALQFHDGTAVQTTMLVNQFFVSAGSADTAYINNTDVESSLMSIALPASFMGVVDTVKGSVDIFFTGFEIGETFTVKLYFGLQNWASFIITNSTVTTQANVGAHIDFKIANRNVAGTQAIFVSIEIPPIDVDFNLGQSGIFRSCWIAGSTVDTTQAQLIQVTGTWSTASLGSGAFGMGAELHKTSK
jgi:hypothetical protein